MIAYVFACPVALALVLRFFHFRSCASSSCFGTESSLRMRSAVRAIVSGGGLSVVDPIDWTIFKGRIFAPEAAPISRDFS